MIGFFVFESQFCINSFHSSEAMSKNILVNLSDYILSLWVRFWGHGCVSTFPVQTRKGIYFFLYKPIPFELLDLSRVPIYNLHHVYSEKETSLYNHFDWKQNMPITKRDQNRIKELKKEIPFYGELSTSESKEKESYKRLVIDLKIELKSLEEKIKKWGVFLYLYFYSSYPIQFGVFIKEK